MTSKDLSIFNSLKPFSIGFDDMFDQFESILGNGGLTQSNYPPYDIRKSGQDKYAIELALAGFGKNDVEIEYEDKLLTVKTKKVDKTVKKDGNKIIHKGISQRSFSKSFTIADDVKVDGAELKDGLLTINCEKIVPEQKKKKLIPIN
jgi:molecular chaperone IbpA